MSPLISISLKTLLSPFNNITVSDGADVAAQDDDAISFLCYGFAGSAAIIVIYIYSGISSGI